MNLSRFLHLRLQGAPLGASVFNGGDDDNKTKSQTQVSYNYDPNDSAARQRLYAEASRIYDTIKGSAASSQYPGAKPIPLSPETKQAQQMLTSTALGPGQKVADAAGQALNFGFKDVLYPSSNPALQAHIDSATRRLGEEFTSPTGPLAQARGYFTGNNSAGTGTREGIAAGLASRSYLNTVGDVTAKLTSDGYKEGLDTFEKTMAFAPNAYSLMTMPAQTLGAVGAQNESVAGINEAFEAAKRNYALTGDWTSLQPYANVILGLSQPGTTTNKESDVSRTQQLMQLAGLGMMGYGMFGGA